jgi:hypothetical protein
MEAYRMPDISWQYRYSISVGDYSYSLGDREPMRTAEDAQAALTTAVQERPDIPVNILGPLEGKMTSANVFDGFVKFADDNDDRSDLDPDTIRDVPVRIVCSEVRGDTKYGE